MNANLREAAVTIGRASVGEPIAFAAEEMFRYVKMMEPERDVLQVDWILAEDEREDVFVLGLFEDVGLRALAADTDSGDVAAFDDHIYIDVDGYAGIIAGSNPRSVLMAVYRYLSEAGCAWVRPGALGEHIPQRDLSEVRVMVDSKPAYRYRGTCIEGAVSYENMLDFIDWSPKVGLNAAMLEFMVPYTFFERWYNHRENPLKEPEGLTAKQVEGFKRGMEREIVRRGLMYHAAGHGWTCEPFGIAGLEWVPHEYDIDDDVRAMLAEVDGERGIFEGIPLNTNLCYSNAEARRLVVDYAVDYVKENPQIDVLHVWLADGKNNHCECEACRGIRPSDLYIVLLNELDMALSDEGLDTKVAFCVYLDLYWPPETERLRNPDRFLLLFCPITRSYSQSYDTDLTGIDLAPYQRNGLTLPRGIRENLAYLRAWQEVFEGDAFTYEYYFMWDNYFDPAYYEAARVLAEDVRRLPEVGLNGIVSDQTQRSFFPTGLGVTVMARALWEDGVDVDALAASYFEAAFGVDGAACREYMASLSALFHPPYLRGDEVGPGADEAARQRLGRVPEVIDGFQPVIARNLDLEDDCHARSWEILSHHAEIAKGLAAALAARAEGELEEARERWEAVKRRVQENEDDLQPVLDVFEFVRTLGRLFA